MKVRADHKRALASGLQSQHALTVASGGGKHEILLSEAPADVAVPRVVGGAGLVGSLAPGETDGEALA